MWFFVIAGAAVVDALATGVWIGKKWGTSSALATTVGADLAAVKAKVAPVVTAVETDVSKVVSALEADVAALRAKVTPLPPEPPAPVATPLAMYPKPIQDALAAQLATTPK